MQQVIYANGKLWGALDTALNPDGGPQRAGIAWYVVNPSTPKVILAGYLGARGHDFTYPATGVTPSGRGVMAFTDTGNTTYPSAAYAPIDALVGVGAWNDVPGGRGAADDGFSGAATPASLASYGRSRGRLSSCPDDGDERNGLSTGRRVADASARGLSPVYSRA